MRWSGDQWTVTSETRVDAMTLPSSDEFARDFDQAGSADRRHGFWFELVDAEGRALYRQVMQHPLLPHEVFGDDGRPYRHGSGGGEAEFEILVPDSEAATEVRFLSDQRGGPEGGLEQLEKTAVVGSVPIRRYPEPDTKDQHGNR